MSGEDNELWVSAEALDVIIDIFSDDKTDKLAAKCNLVENLKRIKIIFKTKVIYYQNNLNIFY